MDRDLAFLIGLRLGRDGGGWSGLLRDGLREPHGDADHGHDSNQNRTGDQQFTIAVSCERVALHEEDRLRHGSHPSGG